MVSKENNKAEPIQIKNDLYSCLMALLESFKPIPFQVLTAPEFWPSLLDQEAILKKDVKFILRYYLIELDVVYPPISRLSVFIYYLRGSAVPERIQDLWFFHSFFWQVITIKNHTRKKSHFL